MKYTVNMVIFVHHVQKIFKEAKIICLYAIVVAIIKVVFTYLIIMNVSYVQMIVK